MLKYYKCYILIELRFLKEMTLIKQVNQRKSVIFVYNCWYFLDKDLSLNQSFAAYVMIYY